MANNSDFQYEIIKHIGVIAEGTKGWKKEVNLISWNGREPKYDIREWNEDHTKMGKGVTFSASEFETLQNLINLELDN